MPQDGAPSSIDVLAAQVREAAEAVEKIAPSPWRYDGRDIFCTRNGAEPHHLLIPLPETWHESQRVPEAVARYVALIDPATVLALVARVTEAEAIVAEYRQAVWEHLIYPGDDGCTASGYSQADIPDELLLAAIVDESSALADARNALEQIAECPEPLNNKGSALTQCAYLKSEARWVLARLDGSSE